MAGSSCPSTGEVLREAFDAALAAGGQQTGRVLMWDETEQLALECAMRAADRREQLEVLFAGELSDNARPTTLTRYSAELRLLDKQIVDCVARVNVGLGQGIKSPQHQRAARSWWDRGRPGRPGSA